VVKIDTNITVVEFAPPVKGRKRRTAKDIRRRSNETESRKMASTTFLPQPVNVFSEVCNIPIYCTCSWTYSHIHKIMQLKHINRSCPELYKHGE
jgi:hypothetical protein